MRPNERRVLPLLLLMLQCAVLLMLHCKSCTQLFERAWRERLVQLDGDERRTQATVTH